VKKILKKFDWWFDYYIAWMFYNGNKTHRYIEYMEKKWGNNAGTEHLEEE
jgi:hypothetical protein